MYGPTVGDRVRLGDTSLWVEVEKDYTIYGVGVANFSMDLLSFIPLIFTCLPTYHPSVACLGIMIQEVDAQIAHTPQSPGQGHHPSPHSTQNMMQHLEPTP